MKQSVRERKRSEAQELMWTAMDVISAGHEQKAARLCNEALAIYPDCVDALTMLAEIKCRRVNDYVDELWRVIEAGRRDLGAKCFKEDKGHFWGLIETRPFMRAMAQLAFALLDWGTPERVDEAIGIFEEMLDLNPDDNQGVRDWLAGCYLARRRYEDAAALFDRYPDDWLAAPIWARVLLAHVTEGEERASELLVEARKRNEHVEQYLTGRKRRPKNRPGMYSPGDNTEAVCCAEMLWEAWKVHPKARAWLKEVCGTNA
jgi:tetratricopeptide (TPR) repeat protein